MNNTPKEKTAAIRAKLKYPSIEVFVQRYSQNISKYGVFLKTSKPKPVGTTVKFELKIADETTVLRGMGEVSWIRESEMGGAPAGMGIKFQKLDSNSRETVKKILVYKKQSSVLSPSRYSEAPPPPENNVAKETAKKEAEEKDRREAEELTKKEAEEKARREAEELAKKEAEKKARREAEELAKKEAEEKAQRAQRAKEKLEEQKRSGAKIEADEEEIDDIVAAFDSIQMPNMESPAAEETPPVEETHIDDTIDTSIAAPNLDEALFEDATLDDADERTSIADLIAVAPHADSTPNDSSPQLDNDGEPQFANAANTDDESDVPNLESSDKEAEEPSEFDFPDTDTDDDTAPIIENGNDAALDTAVDDEKEADIEEISVIEEITDFEEITDDNLIQKAASDDIFVTESVSSNDTDELTLESEDYIIETITEDVVLIDENDVSETLSPAFGVQNDTFDDIPATKSAKQGFDNLVDEYSKGSLEPEPRPEPLLANNTVDNALDDIFQGNTADSAAGQPQSGLEQQVDRISDAPDTLPDDALPQGLVDIVKRKSGISHSNIDPNIRASSAPPSPPAIPEPDLALQPGMPGAQSQWVTSSTPPPPANTEMQFEEEPNPPNYWGASPNPNTGMPGQQSQWGTPGADTATEIDNDEGEKKKGFLGKLFGK